MTDLIHQIYCTHCTYGTSALERREGELASRPLGYSARASSLEMNELRKQYRLLERFLYYYLPSDSPSEDRLRLEADTAPRRLVASLSLSGLQMLAQISYRQFDTAGRAGSYFAHVLVSQRGQQPWPVTQCLQLWGAPWVDTDSADLPFELSPLVELSDLLGGQRPAIDDGVLFSFLTTEPGESFDDPRDVIPPRWRDIAAERRRALLAEALQGFIRLGSTSRDSVVLVVEPSVAALLYYGIARLLPAGDVQSTLGFSTFEPAPERALVPLAATTFRQPEVTDLRPELYRGRGSIRNTFLDKRGGAEHPIGPYVELLLDSLSRQGWPAVDQLLAGFGDAGVKRLEELDLLGRAHSAAPSIFQPAAPFDGTIGQQSPMAAGYLASQVRRELASRDTNQLQTLIGSPHQMAILELVATSVDAITTQPNVQFLLSTLSGDQLAHWLASKTVGPACKTAALASIIAQQGRLPEACAFVWKDETGATDPKAGGSLPIMTAVLSQLQQQVLEQLYVQLREPERPFFLRHLIRACEADPLKLSMLKRILSELPEARFFAVLSEQGAALRRIYPARDAELGARLETMLTELPNQPREFSARLDLLQAWQAWLPDQFLGKRQLQLWQQVRAALLAIGEARNARPAGILQKLAGKERRPNLDDLTHKAAVALDNAVPAPFQPPDGFAARQQRSLQMLGASLLGDTEFIPSGLLSKAAWYFENHHWPPPVSDSRSRSGLPVPLIAAAVVFVLCGVLGFGYFLNQPTAKVAKSPPATASLDTLAVKDPPPPPKAPMRIADNRGRTQSPPKTPSLAGTTQSEKKEPNPAPGAPAKPPAATGNPGNKSGNSTTVSTSKPGSAAGLADSKEPPANAQQNNAPTEGVADTRSPSAATPGASAVVATKPDPPAAAAMNPSVTPPAAPMPTAPMPTAPMPTAPMPTVPMPTVPMPANPGQPAVAKGSNTVGESASVSAVQAGGGGSENERSAGGKKELVMLNSPTAKPARESAPAANRKSQRREVTDWIMLSSHKITPDKSRIPSLWLKDAPRGEMILHSLAGDRVVGVTDHTSPSKTPGKAPSKLLVQAADSKATIAEIHATRDYLEIKWASGKQLDKAPFGRAVLEVPCQKTPRYIALYPQLDLPILGVGRAPDDESKPPTCVAKIPPETTAAVSAIKESTYYIASGELFVEDKGYAFEGKDANGKHAKTVQVFINRDIQNALEVTGLNIEYHNDDGSFIIVPKLRTIKQEDYANTFRDDEEVKGKSEEIELLTSLLNGSRAENENAIRELAGKRGIAVPKVLNLQWGQRVMFSAEKRILTLGTERQTRMATLLMNEKSAYRARVAEKLGNIQRLSVRLYREVDGIRAEDIRAIKRDVF